MTASATSTGLQESRHWLWIAVIPLSLFVALVYAVTQFELPWRLTLPWVPSLGISLGFYIDSLSVLMLSLITGIGVFVFVYAVGYLSHTPDRHRIFLLLPLFMLAMIGAVSADDVILLFVFWEITSILSFLLVGFNHTNSAARDAARQALFVTMAGGVALLAGLILLSQMAGSWSLAEIIAAAPAYRDDPRLTIAILLVLIGAFTKSAQFPFHFWLPNAMSAPTPVSAYLHSATMVKLGIYLMARLDPAFNDLLFWEIMLIGSGTITAIWAAVLALRERDLKRILARSTLSALGTLTLLIGLPSSGAGLAVVAFLFAHAVYKAPLFMVAGNIDHATGTRVIDHLMGLRRVMPWTAAAAVLAGLSMAGLPLAFGFVAKDIILVAKEQADLVAVISYALLLVNAAAMAVAGVAAIRVFWGPLESQLSQVREVGWSMLVPPIFIALIGIEFELFPDFIDPLLLSAGQSISPALQMAEISTSYSIQNMLSAMGITTLIGILLFLGWDRLHDRLSRMRWLDQYGPEASYHALLRGLTKIAVLHTRLIQSGKLNHYLHLTILALLIMAAYIAWQIPGLQFFALLQNEWYWPLHAWSWLAAGLLISLGAIASVMLRDRLSLLMAVGLVGYGSAILFLFSGAPDLAFTQFVVETVLVVVAASLLPVFNSVPDPVRVNNKSFLKIFLAIAAGVGTFFALLNMLVLPENREMFEWFSANSLEMANGRNAVNVIIVDFRALDTLGEIAVVAFALLAAIPLFKGIAPSQASYPQSYKPSLGENSVLLGKIAMPVYWLMLFGAAWILLRGHNEPGGGFIGGLVAVAGSSLLAILHNPAYAKRFQPLSPLPLAMLGVMLALLSGFFGLFNDTGFLRHVWYAGLSSVMLFDLGVFLAVWGSFTGYIYALLQHPDENSKSLASGDQ